MFDEGAHEEPAPGKHKHRLTEMRWVIIGYHLPVYKIIYTLTNMQWVSAWGLTNQ